MDISMLKRQSALLPLAMSVAALDNVLGYMAIAAMARQPICSSAS
jgi:hypothetical protein